MPTFFEQQIEGLSEPMELSADVLGGLQPMARSAWVAPMRGQDSIVTLGRRILMEASVGPEVLWRFISGTPSASTGVEVPYLFGAARLSPGCLPRVSLGYLPSGGVGGTSPVDEGFGRIRLRMTWTDSTGAQESNVLDLELPASTQENFQPLSGAGAAFQELRWLDAELLPPDIEDISERNRWTLPGATLELEAFFIGAPRAVELCVYEAPYRAVYELSDAEQCSHVYAAGDPSGPSGAAGNRPRERRNESTNPRGGTELTLEVARAQRRHLGPVLASWGNYLEGDATSSTGLGYVSVTGSSSGLRYLFDSSLHSYDATREGLSVSSGGYARGYRDNNDQLLGASNAQASIPVVFRVYGRTTTGTTDLRFMTSEDSWVSVTLTSTLGWHSGWGYLEVGLNASQPTVGQAFVDGSRTVQVYSFGIEALRG